MTIDTLRLTAEQVNDLLERREVSSQEIFDAYRAAIDARDAELHCFLRLTDGVGEGIPVTYVPARNTIFLSFALAWCEVLGAADIFVGVNAVDYSGYPDCRPEFIGAFEALANLATRAGVGGTRITVHAPLISISKGDIIRRGLELGVDYALTRSCYAPDPEGRACGVCDSCRIRLSGFAEAGLKDPVAYVEPK